MDELLDHLAEAFDAVDPLVAVAGGGPVGGTPIVAHLVAEQRRCAALVRDAAPRAVDGTEDLLAAYRVCAYDALAALGEPWLLQRAVPAAGDGVTGFVLARALLAETLGHGWELARVTGRELRVRDRILRLALETGRATSLEGLAAALPCAIRRDRASRRRGSVW